MKDSTTPSLPPSASSNNRDEKIPLIANVTSKPIQKTSKIIEKDGETKHHQHQQSCAWWCRHRRGKIKIKGWNTKRPGIVNTKTSVSAGASNSGSLRMETCHCQKTILGYKCNGVMVSSADSMKALLQAEPSRFNALDDFGNNLLHLAFLYAPSSNNETSDHVSITVEHIKFLLEHSPNLALARNRKRHLPLHCAIDCLFNNEEAFGSRENAQEIIKALCTVNSRMILVQISRGNGENGTASDDALDLAHDARRRRPSMGWLYSLLLEIKVKLYKSRKQNWEDKGFKKVFPSGESKSTPSSTSCNHSFIISELGGDWAIDTRGIYT